MGVLVVEQGFDLMLFGMGTVFVFLTLLVIGVHVMSLLVSRFLPEPEVVSLARPKLVAVSKPVDDNVLAAIKGAIEQHRSK